MPNKEELSQLDVQFIRHCLWIAQEQFAKDAENTQHVPTLARQFQSYVVSCAKLRKAFEDAESVMLQF